MKRMEVSDKRKKPNAKGYYMQYRYVCEDCGAEKFVWSSRAHCDCKKVKPPVIIRIVEQPFRKGNKLYFTCDDGNTYTSKQLADLLSISLSRLSLKLKKFGWQSEEVGRTANVLFEANPTQEYLDLSDKPRDYNLDKIPEPGTYEK